MLKQVPFTSGAIGKLASWQPHERALALTQSQNLLKSEEAKHIRILRRLFNLIIVPPFIDGICTGACGQSLISAQCKPNVKRTQSEYKLQKSANS